MLVLPRPPSPLLPLGRLASLPLRVVTALLSRQWVATALVPALSILVMSRCGLIHPPACACSVFYLSAKVSPQPAPAVEPSTSTENAQVWNLRLDAGSMAREMHDKASILSAAADTDRGCARCVAAAARGQRARLALPRCAGAPRLRCRLPNSFFPPAIRVSGLRLG